MADLKDITLFLLDMDGTVNLGYDPIDGAKEFLCTLQEQGKNFIFLTNNSSKNAGDYVEKMRSLGFPCETENVFTSGMAAGMFLSQKKADSLVYVCGTQSLKNELKKYGKEVYCLKQIIVANKCDVYGAEENLKALKEKLKRKKSSKIN